MNQRLNSRTLLLFLPLAYLLLFLFVPLIMTFSAGILEGDKGFGEVVKHLLVHPLYGKVLLNTVWISCLVTVATLFIGYPIAFFLTRCNPKWERIVLTILVSSMWLSILIRSYAWTIMLQMNGPINGFLVAIGLLQQPVSLMFSRFAVVIGMTHVLLPYMVLIIWTAMKRHSRRLEQVAYSLGATKTLYFFRVFLPNSRSGVTAGTLLVFLLSFGFYITPALLGGGKGETMMVSMLIEERMNTLGDWKMGSAMAILLLAFIVIPMSLTWFSRTVREIWQELFSGVTSD